MSAMVNEDMVIDIVNNRNFFNLPALSHPLVNLKSFIPEVPQTNCTAINITCYKIKSRARRAGKMEERCFDDAASSQ